RLLPWQCLRNVAPTAEADARGGRLGDNAAMIAWLVRCGSVGLLALLSSAADACERGSFALFGCEADKSRKFIELCAPSPLDSDRRKRREGKRRSSSNIPPTPRAR